jgi:hypothetical protein
MAPRAELMSIPFAASNSGSVISCVRASSTISEFLRIHILARGTTPLGRLQQIRCSAAHATMAHENGSNAIMCVRVKGGVKYLLFLIGGLQDVLQAFDYSQRVGEGDVDWMNDGVERQLKGQPSQLRKHLRRPA